MASVRMTKDLRSGILSKFREALVATALKNPKIVDLGDTLYDMVHTPLEKEWLQLTSKLMHSYDGSAQKRKNALSVTTSSSLCFILCPLQDENIEQTSKIKDMTIYVCEMNGQVKLINILDAKKITQAN